MGLRGTLYYKYAIPAALFYIQNLIENPLKTKAITAASLNGLQEILSILISGNFVENPDVATPTKALVLKSFDPKVIKMALYGLLVSGPLGHFLYELLAKITRGRSGALVTIFQLLVANLVFSPIQNSVYIAAMAIINGESGLDPVKLSKLIEKRLPVLMKVSWVISPLAQLIAFKKLPPAMWTPFYNLVGFIFGVWANSNAKIQAAAAARRR
ncbi:hypothetical protein GQ42DRAFT_120541 [Ramicandelaber brevisporus]|nr:hypothetical protein GQ42DRAFT_120541 [Ramicandelaber brevisporus]